MMLDIDTKHLMKIRLVRWHVMSKKWISTLALIGLAVVLAGCSGAALNEVSPQAENEAQVESRQLMPPLLSRSRKQ